jgi:hypothetical protein
VRIERQDSWEIAMIRRMHTSKRLTLAKRSIGAPAPLSTRKRKISNARRIPLSLLQLRRLTTCGSHRTPENGRCDTRAKDANGAITEGNLQAARGRGIRQTRVAVGRGWPELERHPFGGGAYRRAAKREWVEITGVASFLDARAAISEGRPAAGEGSGEPRCGGLISVIKLDPSTAPSVMFCEEDRLGEAIRDRLGELRATGKDLRVACITGHRHPGNVVRGHVQGRGVEWVQINSNGLVDDVIRGAGCYGDLSGKPTIERSLFQVRQRGNKYLAASGTRDRSRID